jgi:hypothetical protein
MPSARIVGKRGENLFRVLITQWCGGEQWFEETFDGETAEGLDFTVYLIDPTVFKACFRVQVKTAVKANRYSGTGGDRKILVRLRQEDARKIGTMAMPVYVVGIDVWSGEGYIRPVLSGTTKGFTGISTRFRLNCRAIRKLWQEVEEFWNQRSGRFHSSEFEG